MQYCHNSTNCHLGLRLWLSSKNVSATSDNADTILSPNTPSQMPLQSDVAVNSVFFSWIVVLISNGRCWNVLLLHSVSDITGSGSKNKGKSYSYRITVLQRLLRLHQFEASRISKQLANESDKFASTTHRPLWPLRDIPGTLFCQRLIRPQGHSAAGRIMSIKIPNGPFGNRNRNLTACSAVTHRLCHRVPQQQQ